VPVFEYKCLKCGEKFELLVGVGKENNELKCPGCGSKDLSKLFSAFRFKGGNGSGASSCGTCAASNCNGCNLS